MKQLLTVGTNSKTGKHFIMGKQGQLEGTPYYNSYKECFIALSKIDGGCSIYDLSQDQYNKQILN